MLSLTLPPIVGFTKTIKSKPHSHAIDSFGYLQTSVTGNFMPSTIEGTANLNDFEYAKALDVVTKAGDSAVFFKDPIDFTTSAERTCDGFGGWSQGVYIPGYNQISGFFAKLYALDSRNASEPDLLYIRPIANPFNITVYNGTTPYPGNYDPLTQIATVNGVRHNGFSAAQFEAGFGTPHAFLSGDKHMYPATFDFEQAYKVDKFESNLAGRSGAYIAGCGMLRPVTFSLVEVYWNTRACWVFSNMIAISGT